MEAHRQFWGKWQRDNWKKRNLINHLVVGNDIRFSLNDRSLYSSIQSATLVGDENDFVQSLFHIDMSGYNIFKSDTDWVFIICVPPVTYIFPGGLLVFILTEDKQKQLWLLNGMKVSKKKSIG